MNRSTDTLVLLLIAVAGYDREFTTVIDRRAQIRVGFSTDRGEVAKFFVQLEYWLEDEWKEVARFDHHPDSEMGHDIVKEGLHMDVYRDEEKVDVENDFPPVALSRAIRYRITYLEENSEQLIRRFEQWHNVNDRHP